MQIWLFPSEISKKTKVSVFYWNTVYIILYISVNYLRWCAAFALGAPYNFQIGYGAGRKRQGQGHMWSAARLLSGAAHVTNNRVQWERRSRVRSWRPTEWGINNAKVTKSVSSINTGIAAKSTYLRFSTILHGCEVWTGHWRTVKVIYTEYSFLGTMLQENF